MFKKIDATRLDVCIAYACGAFLLYVVGAFAYQVGWDHGKAEVREAIHEIYAKGRHIEIHEDES